MYEGSLWYEWNFVYVWRNFVYGWNFVIWMPVKYIYTCHIYLEWKLFDLIKNRKNSQYAGSLPSATDGKELFAVCRGRQRSHVAANCASWELTHLVSLPTVGDDKAFSYSGRRQRSPPLPTVAAGKALMGSDAQLTSFGRRQRPDALCRQLADGKDCR